MTSLHKLFLYLGFFVHDKSTTNDTVIESISPLLPCNDHVSSMHICSINLDRRLIY